MTHLDRLNQIDASFLLQEHDNTHMHIGAVAIFDGPPPEVEEFRAGMRDRLHLVPRYRQRIAEPPLGLGRPMWVDDPHFNIEYHVRETALPAPGSAAQLRALTARIFSQRLDRSKPLWELWVVHNLEDRRFALITKTHHSMIDGVSGADLMTVLFDVTPRPREIAPEPWAPPPAPSTAQLVAEELRGLVAEGVGTATAAAGLALRPDRLLREIRDRAEGLAGVAWTGLNPPASTPLTQAPGTHRRVDHVFASLEDFKTIKNHFGCTVNDAVLAVVTGALARFLHSRGLPTEGVELRAAVPVSVRSDEQRGSLGNELTQLVCPLPVYIDDPVERVRVVTEAMDGVKHSKLAAGAKTITNLEGFAPPTLLAQASRLHFSTRFYSLLVTNVPGPQFPLYMQGRELESICPVAFLGGDHTLAIAIMSYNGGVCFGLIADYDLVPDLDIVAEAIRQSIVELVELAAEGEPASIPTRGVERAGSTARSNGHAGLSEDP